MVEMSEEEFAAAEERGQIEMLTKPRALTASFDARSGMMTLHLTTDCTFSFNPRALQGLEQATDRQLTNVEIMGVGYGLGWDDLDQHYTVEGLMAGRFGTGRHMDRLRADPAFRARMMRRPGDTGAVRKDAA